MCQTSMSLAVNVDKELSFKRIRCWTLFLAFALLFAASISVHIFILDRNGNVHRIIIDIVDSPVDDNVDMITQSFFSRFRIDSIVITLGLVLFRDPA